MTIQEYEDLTGKSVPASQVTQYTAMLRRVQRQLEALLGYSLDPDELETNQYDETGKTQADCPCVCTDVGDLDPADPVVYAYRLFTYNQHDKYLFIDPATAVHSVKLVKDGITFRTLDPDQYRLHYKNGVIRYIERCNNWCFCQTDCGCTQLAVDATWSFEEVPLDLQDVMAEMITYEVDCKKDIQSETLGPHSYRKFDRTKPQESAELRNIMMRYAGPNGTLNKEITL